MLRRLISPNQIVGAYSRALVIGCRSVTTTTVNDEDDIVHLDDRPDIQIPVYQRRPNEPLGKQKQRLVYQSRKRGMLENDLLLSTFAAKFLPTMNESQTEMYDNLINIPSNDWDIYYWATGNKEIPPQFDNEIMTMFIEHVRNEKKEKRLRMPDLAPLTNQQ